MWETTRLFTYYFPFNNQYNEIPPKSHHFSTGFFLPNFIMTNTEIKVLISLTKSEIHAYEGYSKANFKRLGTKYLKMIAKRLGCTEKVSWNPGGIAVSGDIILHTEHLYVNMSQCGLGMGFMYRSCKGIKDYTGGTNHWMQWEKLLDVDYVVDAFKNVK